MLLPAFVRVALFTISMVSSELQNEAIVTEFALIQDNETFPITSEDNDVLVKTPYEFNETFLDNESSITVETPSIINITVDYDLSDGSDNATDSWPLWNATEIWTETSESGPFEVGNDEDNVTTIFTVTSERGFGDDEQGQGNSTETWTATSDKIFQDEGNGTDVWTEVPEAGVSEGEPEHEMTTVMTIETVTTEKIDVDQTDEDKQQQPGSFGSGDDDLGINTIPGEEEAEEEENDDDGSNDFGFRIRFNIPRVLLPYTPPPVDFFRRLFGPLGSYGVRNWDDSQFTWRGVRIPWPLRPAARWQGHQIPT